MIIADLRTTRRVALVFVLVIFQCSAAIDYFPETNTIVVNDYPPEIPCTPKLLLAADKIYGWRKVRDHLSSDMIVVEANLQIGAADGTETHFIVGGAKAPNQTLLMRGNLVVHPTAAAGSSPKRRKAVNQLTVGDPDGAGTMSAVKFDCREEAQYGLSVGRFLDEGGRLGDSGHGARLIVRNGMISAAAKSPKLRFGGPGPRRHVYLQGDRVILQNAVLSRAVGALLYGLPDDDSAGDEVLLEDSTFASAANAFVAGRRVVNRCVFEDFGSVVVSEGPLAIVFNECEFRNNDRNWTLTRPDASVVCVDCRVEPPRLGNAFEGDVEGAAFVEKRHAIVQVIDEQGRPIPTAEVEITSAPVDAAAVVNGRLRVGIDGRTPGEDQPERAALLTIRRVTATPKKKGGETVTYVHSIKAMAPGFAPGVVKRFSPKRSWETVTVTLGQR